jgi:aldehyde:ferredoxin oxidoreductase
MALTAWMGQILFVDLSTGRISEWSPGEETYRKYLGGYGLGAYILYTRQRAGVAPLGPESLLGFLTGPLTGTPAITGTRFCVVGKSPKTGGWGDANCGGRFGPILKQAGFDAVFFTGISPKPVYLFIDHGRAELMDASELWGRDTDNTEDRFEGRYGKGAAVACIGPAGERQSLISCVINDKGRAAGRSGLGALMGSKMLKAVVARGNQAIPLADEAAMKNLRSACIEEMKNNPLYQFYRTYGTSGALNAAVQMGDCPVKNWSGSAEDFPYASKISDESVLAIEDRKYGCLRCPIACGGQVKVEGGPYAMEGHKPEYETLAAFGPLTLVDNLAAICKCNDICNRAGLDSISTGCTIAFAMECYENGLITRQDTGGVDLSWGNHEAVVRMTELIAQGRGFGKILENGIRRAAEQIGKGADKYAVHIQAEEVPMHDPRFSPGLATIYKLDATPGRHTQGGAWSAEMKFAPRALADRWAPWGPKMKYEYTGKAKCHRVLSAFGHAYNALGVCYFGALIVPPDSLAQFLSHGTGRDFTIDDLLEIGDRIATLRIAFNLREGIRNAEFKIPGRVIGSPPLMAGSLKGITVDLAIQEKEYFEEMGWDSRGVPLEETLRRLGLEYVVLETCEVDQCTQGLEAP